MNATLLSAVGLVEYAAVVAMTVWLWRDLIPPGSAFLSVGEAVARIVAALLLALAGPLWQRFVPNRVGEYIIINLVAFGSTLASELALVLVLFGLLGSRANARAGALNGGVTKRIGVVEPTEPR